MSKPAYMKPMIKYMEANPDTKVESRGWWLSCFDEESGADPLFIDRKTGKTACCPDALYDSDGLCRCRDR